MLARCGGGGLRMAEVVERLDGVERRLTSVETGLSNLRGEVGELRGEVQKLRILGEKNTTDIQQIAEVQVQHGNRLDEIAKALEPLARLDAFVQLWPVRTKGE